MDVELSSGFTAKVRMRIPAGLATGGYDGSTSYPLLIDVYGGPESQVRKPEKSRFALKWK